MNKARKKEGRKENNTGTQANVLIFWKQFKIYLGKQATHSENISWYKAMYPEWPRYCGPSELIRRRHHR